MIYTEEELNNFLIIAIIHGKIDDMKSLIEKGASINATYYDTSCLNLAIRYNQIESVKYLIQLGADVNYSTDPLHLPIYDAVDVGNCELIQLLIDNKASLQHEKNIYHYGKSKRYNVLSKAIKNKNIEVIKLLLKNKAIIECNEATNNLEEAIDENSLEIVKLLIENGADINSYGILGILMLNCALKYEKYDIAYYLIDSDINLEKFYNHVYTNSHYKEIIQNYLNIKSLNKKLNETLKEKDNNKKDKTKI